MHENPNLVCNTLCHNALLSVKFNDSFSTFLLLLLSHRDTEFQYFFLLSHRLDLILELNCDLDHVLRKLDLVSYYILSLCVSAVLGTVSKTVWDSVFFYYSKIVPKI